MGSRLVDKVFTSVEQRVETRNPLIIGVREDPHGGGDGFQLAARSPAGLDETLQRATDCSSLFNIAKGAGAVNVRQSTTDLVLEGRASQDVTIVNLRAKIRKREPPLSGAQVTCQSAGAIDAIGVIFNLDEPNPAARKIKPGMQPGRAFFERGNVVNLVKGEVQPFQVVAQVTDSYVEWEIEAEVLIDGKPQAVVIDNDGQPFRLAGWDEGARYDRYFEWVWYEQPPYLYAGEVPKP